MRLKDKQQEGNKNGNRDNHYRRPINNNRRRKQRGDTMSKSFSEGKTSFSVWLNDEDLAKLDKLRETLCPGIKLPRTTVFYIMLANTSK